MPRLKKQNEAFYAKMQKLSERIVPEDSDGRRKDRYSDSDILEPLDVRVRRVLRMSESVQNKRGKMLFFVMYDIESNKVRTQVAKYLLRNGCFRIQNSIFMAEADTMVYQKMREDLAKVQAAYDNNDSIIVLPISTDHMNMMKIIGRDIDVDVITHRKNTIFL